MEKIKQIIEDKYYWRADYRLILDWAEVAFNQGTDSLLIMDFVISRLFQKAA